MKHDENRLLNKLGSLMTAGWRGPPWISVLSWWFASTDSVVLELWVAALSCVKGTVHPKKENSVFYLLSCCVCVCFLCCDRVSSRLSLFQISPNIWIILLVHPAVTTLRSATLSVFKYPAYPPVRFHFHTLRAVDFNS